MITSRMPVCPADWIECRKRNGVSLPAIAAATKISSRYLEAIEGGKFDKLPGAAYDLSYIRQYARAIHYEEDQLLEYYRGMVMSEEASHAPPPAPDTWISRVRDCIRSLRATARYSGVFHSPD
jgi:cytoskeletal protein RodZ